MNHQSVLTDNASDDEVEYTTTNKLNKVKLYANSVELIGYVTSIDGCKTRGPHCVFNFVLSNGEANVQVTAWNAEIDRVESTIASSSIVHVDGGYSKPIEKK